MNKKSDIQNKVEATLNSLEGITSATPGPYFFTRVQARMQKAEKNVWEKISAYIARPTVAFAMVGFVLLMNTIAVLQHTKTSDLASDQSDQSVYEEFNVAANTFYDYEIKEP
jgi:hypothetical protein